LPDISCNLPGSLDGQPSDAPLFGLAPGGVCHHSGRPEHGALLPHRFTLTTPPLCSPLRFGEGSGEGLAVYFLLHFPSRYHDFALQSALPCGVRTFLRITNDPATVCAAGTEIVILFQHPHKSSDSRKDKISGCQSDTTHYTTAWEYSYCIRRRPHY